MPFPMKVVSCTGVAARIRGEDTWPYVRRPGQTLVDNSNIKSVLSMSMVSSEDVVKILTKLVTA